MPKPLVQLFGVNKSVVSREETSQDAVMRWQERADVNKRSQRMEKSFQGLRSTGRVVIILVVETMGDTDRSTSLTWADCLLRQSFFCKFRCKFFLFYCAHWKDFMEIQPLFTRRVKEKTDDVMTWPLLKQKHVLAFVFFSPTRRLPQSAAQPDNADRPSRV